MSHTKQSLEQIFQRQVQNLALTLQPFTVVKYQYVARYFVAYLRENFPESAGFHNFVAIPICWGGFAGFASCVRRSATTPASSVYCVFAGYSTIWPFKDTRFSPALSSAKTFPRGRNTCRELYLRKMINDFKRNCGEQTLSIPMLFF